MQTTNCQLIVGDCKLARVPRGVRQVPSEDVAARIGANLRRERRRAGMTQEELARRVGVTRQTIIAIESGKYAPSLPLAMKLARVFGRSVEEVFELVGKG